MKPYPTLVNVRERKPIGKKVKNINRVERTLKLLVYLSNWRTIKEVANHLQISDRTVQRYFKMLLNLGFIVETNSGVHYVHKIKNVKEFFDIQ